MLAKNKAAESDSFKISSSNSKLAHATFRTMLSSRIQNIILEMHVLAEVQSSLNKGALLHIYLPTNASPRSVSLTSRIMHVVNLHHHLRRFVM